MFCEVCEANGAGRDFEREAWSKVESLALAFNYTVFNVVYAFFCIVP